MFDCDATTLKEMSLLPTDISLQSSNHSGQARGQFPSVTDHRPPWLFTNYPHRYQEERDGTICTRSQGILSTESSEQTRQPMQKLLQCCRERQRSRARAVAMDEECGEAAPKAVHEHSKMCKNRRTNPICWAFVVQVAARAEYFAAA